MKLPSDENGWQLRMVSEGTIDIDGLEKMSTALISSEAPSILAELEEAKNRARSANMSERAFKTNFGSLGSIDSLGQFIVKDLGAADPVEMMEGYSDLTPEKQARLKELEAKNVSSK